MSSLLIYAVAVCATGALVYGAVRCFAPRSAAITLPGEIVPSLRVLTRTRVGVGRTLVVVEVEGRRLLLGSTREQWSALADLGAARGAEQDPFDGIEEELLRASEAARHRRGLRS